jgi:hypothetical protein
MTVAFASQEAFSFSIYLGYLGVYPVLVDMALAGPVHSPDLFVTFIVRGAKA